VSNHDLSRSDITPVKSEAGSEMRTWTDHTGKRTIQAEYLSGDEQSVQIRLPNGKVMTSRLEWFSQQDQEFVRQKRESSSPTGVGSSVIRQTKLRSFKLTPTS
jgi:hypothetical protein